MHNCLSYNNYFFPYCCTFIQIVLLLVFQIKTNKIKEKPQLNRNITYDFASFLHVGFGLNNFCRRSNFTSGKMLFALWFNPFKQLTYQPRFTIFYHWFLVKLFHNNIRILNMTKKLEILILMH